MSYPSPQRDKLLRALLGNSARNVPLSAQAELPLTSLYDLSKRTGIVYSWVHKNLKTLEAKGWVTTQDRIEILDPAAVFEWWKAHRTEPDIHSFHIAEPTAAVDALYQDEGIRYAITTYYAENTVQGHLFPRRMDAYIADTDLPRARDALIDAGAQLGGTNFRLWTGDDAILEEIVSIGQGPAQRRYAPVPQVIVDLMTEGGSAGEAADLLIQRAYPHANTSLS